MEKESFVKNGELRLPPGFRFHPTDEELVVQYLKRKVFSCPLPALIIPELDAYKSDPWDLPGDYKRERYFFTTREAKYLNGNRHKRATGSGYWKGIGADKPIVAARSNQVVGMKKILAFYGGKPPKGTRTDWIMHEYRLSDAAGSRSCVFPQRKNSTQNFMMQTEDWVLCRIFTKKRSTGNELEIIETCNKSNAKNFGVARNNRIDFMIQQTKSSVSPSSSSSSSSNVSSITELTVESQDEENTS
ncbi:NAC domain-containing protein 83-like [Magnolia sinica]|uniref:NAC domain-containing protein 83-like n=1 Tax=Magnolia sinica TaxID=86752 RepID=UPI00265B4AD6|nr:NAC domain-containing protein 83-like [Magnolia sinica]